MSRLNWEADRRRRQPRDTCTDAPPITGSWADQARYGVYQGRDARSSGHSAGATSVRSRAFDFEQLRQYATHAVSIDFRRKSPTQRAEVLGIIQRLLMRCRTWQPSIAKPEAASMELAQRVLAGQRQ